MSGRHFLLVSSFLGALCMLGLTGCERHDWEGSVSELHKPHHGHGDHGEDHGAEGDDSHSKPGDEASSGHGEEHHDDDHDSPAEGSGEGRSVFGGEG